MTKEHLKPKEKTSKDVKEMKSNKNDEKVEIKKTPRLKTLDDEEKMRNVENVRRKRPIK